MKKIFITIIIFLFTISCKQVGEYQYANLNFELAATNSNNNAVTLDIESIKIYFSAPSEAGQWITLSDVNTGLYNLEDIINGKSSPLAYTNIVEGTISQVNIGFGQNSSFTNELGTFNLEYPVAETSGVTIELNEAVNYGADKTIFLDFDANKSVVKTVTGTYQLQPSIRIYSKESTGIIEGTVTPIESKPIISAIMGDNIVSTKTDIDGYFCISGLNEGTYLLNIEPISSYVAQSFPNFNLSAATKENIGTIILENNELIAGTITGDLNLNPSSDENELFSVQTPTELIDITRIQNEGDLFTYNGPATFVQIMPKAEGATLTIDGSDIVLDKSIRYTIQAEGQPLNVNLRNKKSGNGNWWIEISGSSASITPKPLTTN